MGVRSYESWMELEEVMMGVKRKLEEVGSYWS